MHGESALVDITFENIQNELRKIEELLGPYDPADIMNFDETARANLLSMAAIEKKHEIEYHYSTNAWMTNEIFTAYVKKLDVAFGRQNRKIALLLDNASVHKIRIPLNNIKLIFILANTTSKLQALDAVKLETVNGMLPDLPRNFDNKVADVSQWNLEAVESEMIVCYTTSTTNNEETAEGNIDEIEENDNTEQDEKYVDIVECKKRLREAYETTLMCKFPLDDLDRKLHGRIRMRLADSCAELKKSKEQTDLRSYSCKW
ncbi:hypothetical protein G6F43_008583 [Rhizopus delemar]|nr:hypothetical protein G6F43_008583 [Rhizopus delemar]